MDVVGPERMDSTMTDILDTRVDSNPPDDACRLSRIEVEFAIPVWMTQEQQRNLVDTISDIVGSAFNQPVAGVHWVGGIGSKPNFSVIDAALLGVEAGANPPADGEEPTFDDTIFQIQSNAREFMSEREEDQVRRERDILRDKGTPSRR